MKTKLVGAALAAIIFGFTSGIAPAQDGAPKPAANQHAANQPVASQPTDAPIRAPDTLMFTIDEYNDIQGHLARGGGEEEKKDANIEAASLYLSSILYSGPQDWTVWINGMPITPQQDFQSFKITEISPRYIDLLVPLSAQGMQPVRLGPNQTFLVKLGVVVEGHQ